MEQILSQLASEQSDLGDAVGNVTIVFANGASLTGILESTEGGVVSIRRDLDYGRGESYADIPRHFAITSVIGAYYTEGS